MTNDIDPTTGLPPAGHERDEELLKRHDNLQQAAEEQEADVHTIAKPQVFREERELQHIIREEDGLNVSNPLPGHVYCWVYTGLQGQKVWQKKAQGWEVVQGNDPESAEYKFNDTTRRIGDTMLMRISMDKHLKLVRAGEIKLSKLEEGIASELQELGDRAGGAFKVHADPATNPHINTMEARSRGSQQVAMKHVDKMLRRGTVPGVPVK